MFSKRQSYYAYLIRYETFSPQYKKQQTLKNGLVKSRLIMARHYNYYELWWTNRYNIVKRRNIKSISKMRHVKIDLQEYVKGARGTWR